MNSLPNKIDVRPPLTIYSNAKHYSYKVVSAVSEFIDNSIASFKKNDKYYANIKKNIAIIFDNKNRSLTVIDNAYGIADVDLQRAVQLDAPPVDRSGLNEFGMGLKCAAFWFGTELTIITKNPNCGGYKLELTLRDLENGVSFIPVQIKDDYKLWNIEHGTVININDIYIDRNFVLSGFKSSPQTKGIIDKIGYRYQRNIDEGINIFVYVKNNETIYDAVDYCKNNVKEGYDLNKFTIFNGKPIPKYVIEKYDGTYNHIKTTNGFERHVSYIISSENNNKEYHANGTFYIRKNMKRAEAGIDFYRRGRIVEEKYKDFFPDSSSYSYARINGCFDLDDFPVSQTKDAIDWGSDLLELLKQKVKDDSIIKELCTIANGIRAREEDENYVHQISKIPGVSNLSLNDAKKIANENNINFYEEKDAAHEFVLTDGHTKLNVFMRTIEDPLKPWLQFNHKNQNLVIAEVNTRSSFFSNAKTNKKISEEQKIKILNNIKSIAFFWALAESETKIYRDDPMYDQFMTKLDDLIKLNNKENFKEEETDIDNE